MTDATDFDADGARAILDGEISLDPEFKADLEDANRRLGEIADGIPSPLGLLPVDDAELPVVLPENCALLQIVIRRNDTFFFDPKIVAALSVTSPIQPYILQLHEEIYFLATQNSHAGNSVGAQLALISLMTDNLNNSFSIEQMLVDNGVLSGISWLDLPVAF